MTTNNDFDFWTWWATPSIGAIAFSLYVLVAALLFFVMLGESISASLNGHNRRATHCLRWAMFWLVWPLGFAVVAVVWFAATLGGGMEDEVPE